jgi:hypothetical protein
MSDVKSILDRIGELAKLAAPLIPGGALVSGGIDLGEKILDLVNGADQHPEAATSAELRAGRQALIDAVTAKANKTADRFDG